MFGESKLVRMLLSSKYLLSHRVNVPVKQPSNDGGHSDAPVGVGLVQGLVLALVDGGTHAELYLRAGQEVDVVYDIIEKF